MLTNEKVKRPPFCTDPKYHILCDLDHVFLLYTKAQSPNPQRIESQILLRILLTNNK